MNEEQEQPSEAIVRRIQKLLSLGQGQNNSGEEAAAAMAMAQKMLARYNLDYHTVQAAQVAGGTNVVEEAREQVQVNLSAQYQWQRELWKAIAEANFCWHWVTKVHVQSHLDPKVRVWANRHFLLGRTSNVLMVRMMGEYLCQTIERMVPYKGGQRMSRSAASWRAGCADTLIERIEADAAKARKAQPTDASGTGLSLRTVEDLEYQGNYDAKHGKGAWARQQEWEKQYALVQAERAEQARLRRIEEQKEWDAYLATETPEQKKAREKEEERERLCEARKEARRRYSWRGARASTAREVDYDARDAGRSAGSNISLSRQAGAGVATRRLK